VQRSRAHAVALSVDPTVRGFVGGDAAAVLERERGAVEPKLLLALVVVAPHAICQKGPRYAVNYPRSFAPAKAAPTSAAISGDDRSVTAEGNLEADRGIRRRVEEQIQAVTSVAQSSAGMITQ
jgi:hypothetical protein